MSKKNKQEIEDAYQYLVILYYALDCKPVVIPKYMHRLLLSSKHVRGPLPAYFLNPLPQVRND